MKSKCGSPPIIRRQISHRRVPTPALVAVLAVPWFAGHAAETESGAPGISWPGEAIDSWHGFSRHNFTVDGCAAWVVEPKQALPGRPWSWSMEFPDAFTDRCAAPALLERGFHHAHIAVGNTFGCPSAIRHLDAFYVALVSRGLDEKAVLVGLSRGGLYAYRWASEHPERVAVIYGDAPVCDFKSWPGGKGNGRGSPGDWAELLKCYGFKDEAEALAWRGNPVDALEPLANGKVALIHVVGDADDVVPPEENTAVVEDRYRKLGGEIVVIHKPGIGHHPHGLEDPSPVVRFILDRIPGEGAEANRAPGASAKSDVPGRWTVERARRWMEGRVVRGFNYNVRTAVNDIEQWQVLTFDPKTIEQEFGWAQGAGYNSVRTFLSYTVWLDDPPGFRARLREFLDISRRHGLSTMPVLFADGEFSGRIGTQPDPIPGVHNSRAVVDPGIRVALDPQQWPPLKAYVRDIVGAFAKDDGIIAWDVYNEPGNSPAGEKVLPLLEAVFSWAREARPEQPLTAAPWMSYGSPFSQRLLALSDIATFHDYEPPEKMVDAIRACSVDGRPLLCTEWLRRQVGNTFAAILPIFADHRVGWYQWGLVAGRTQTYFHWGSKPGTPPPAIWQHDVLHPDGRAYDPSELELVRKWAPLPASAGKSGESPGSRP